MSPTIFIEKNYRFFFFSKEEPSIHVHVYCPDGEAKFWIEPEIAIAKNYRLSGSQIEEIIKIIEAHYEEIKNKWKEYFES